MKRICIIFIFITVYTTVSAQKTGDKSKTNTDTNLIPSEAFNKMIINEITYAIFGESSPVSGIKVDVSKPEATISGIFQPKNKAIKIGLEFKGGITDRNWSIIRGQNSFNTAFEFRPSFHFITKHNKGRYYTVNKPVLKAKNAVIALRRPLVNDSFYAVAIIYNTYLTNYPGLNDKTTNLQMLAKTGLVKYFIKKLCNKQDQDFTGLTTLAGILTQVPQATYNKNQMASADYKEEIFDSYYKFEKLYNEAEEKETEMQIQNVSKAWSLKKYWWFTVSPYARTEKITEFHSKFQGLDSLYFKPNYPIYYGINAWLNHYRLFPNKVAIYMRAGLNISRANNISGLSSFTYETRTPFFSAGSTVTEKVKSGSAYNYNQIKMGLLSQWTGEIYVLPLKTFIPGIYISASVSKSKLFRLPDIKNRENDKSLIPIEGGFLFNINSREKDKEKNILSLSFYTRFEDLSDKRRVTKTDNLEESKEDFMKRNFSMGIKFGIPISLPQKGG